MKNRRKSRNRRSSDYKIYIFESEDKVKFIEECFIPKDKIEIEKLRSELKRLDERTKNTYVECQNERAIKFLKNYNFNQGQVFENPNRASRSIFSGIAILRLYLDDCNSLYEKYKNRKIEMKDFNEYTYEDLALKDKLVHSINQVVEYIFKILIYFSKQDFDSTHKLLPLYRDLNTEFQKLFEKKYKTIIPNPDNISTFRIECHFIKDSQIINCDKEFLKNHPDIARKIKNLRKGIFEEKGQINFELAGQSFENFLTVWDLCESNNSRYWFDKFNNNDEIILNLIIFSDFIKILNGIVDVFFNQIKVQSNFELKNIFSFKKPDQDFIQDLNQKKVTILELFTQFEQISIKGFKVQFHDPVR